jgi:predicted permease
MRFAPGIRRLFRLPASAGRLETEVSEELRFHLEARVDDLVAEGMTNAQAQVQAIREFGDLEAARAELRRMALFRLDRQRRREWWRDFGQDFRVAVRGFRTRPGFTLLAGGTIALGVGAVSALFTIARFILLEPLPYPGAERLVAVWERNDAGVEIPVSGPNARDWRAGARTLEGLAVYRASRTTVLGGNRAVRVMAAQVSGDFFPVLRTPVARGRSFTDPDLAPGAPPTVLVSHGFWRAQLGGDPELDARLIEVDDSRRAVIGVLPEGFGFPDETDLWVPVGLDQAVEGESRTGHNWRVVARVRESAMVAEARAELERIQHGIMTEYGEGGVDAVGTALRPLREEATGSVERPLLLLLGASALVLLVACTNVASMFLARGAGRRNEFAVRASLGAGRPRLIRQLFAEGMSLSLAGTAVGLAAAGLLIRLTVGMAPGLGVPRLAQVELDWWSVGFAAVVAITAAVLFGLLPAFRSTERHADRALLVAGVMAPGRTRQWGLLVAAEMALATLLAVGAGLLLRSFRELMAVDSGIEARGVLTIATGVPSSRHPDDPAIFLLHQELQTELRRTPGVVESGLVTHLPVSGGSLNGGFEVEGRRERGYGDYRVADAGFFRTFRIPLRRGRLFQAQDAAGAPHVALINEVLADQRWPGENPVGQRIRDLANDSFQYGEDAWITIVGVVGNVRDQSLAAPVQPTIYVHLAQRPFRARYANIVARSASPPAALVPGLRNRLAERFPDLPVEVRTMEDRLSASVGPRRFTLVVFGLFAGTALMLSMIGVYGVVSYRVERRTRELGVRIALGADAGAVRRMVLASALLPVVAGLGLGMILAAFGSRVLASMVFGITVTDAATFLAVPAVLLLAAALASLVPAWRATRVDPLVALRGP